MKVFVWVLGALGIVLFSWSAYWWASLGFPMDFGTLAVATGKKPWSFDKDNPLIFLILGVMLILYATFELARTGRSSGKK